MPEMRQGPRNRSSEGTESAEQKVREHFDLRLRFAEAMSEKSGEPLAKCLHNFTDLRLRIMGPDPEDHDEYDEHMTKWESFTNDVEAIPDHNARLDALMQLFRAKPGQERTDHREDPYWPFRYDFVGDRGEPFIGTHFGSMRLDEEPQEGPGLLSKERYEEQRAKLRAMFIEIKQKYPSVKTVRGRSWLYNLDAYRRLYPATYGESRTIAKGIYAGGGRWGQFKMGDGSVNKEFRDVFIRNLEQLDPKNPEAAFPMQTWTVEAPIQDFYKEYGIE